MVYNLIFLKKINFKLFNRFKQKLIEILTVCFLHFQILYKVWPSMNHFVRQLCKQNIEPSIVEKLTEYKIKGFQFDRLVLGRIVSLFLFSTFIQFIF